MCFLIVSISFAQSKPSVIVSPMRGSQSKSAVQAITSELQKTGRVLIVGDRQVADFMDKYSASQKPASSKEALAFFKQGKQAYQNLDIKNAVDYYRKAERLYKGTLWDEDSFAAFRTTKFHLAQSYLALGRTDEANIEMREVMLLDPDRKEKKLSEKYYSPQVRNLYKTVLEGFQKGEIGDVVLSSEPSGAVVFFDGKKMGNTPLSIKNIPVGKHYFRFVLQGHEEKLNEQFVVVGQNRISARLASAKDKNLGRYFDTVGDVGEIANERVKFLDEIGLALGGDIFLFLTPLSGKVRGQLFDQRSQEISPAMESSNPQSLVAKLQRYLGRDGYVLGQKDALEVAQSQNAAIESSSKSNQRQGAVNTPAEDIQYTPVKKDISQSTGGITKRWWFWPAVGVVVVGAGAGFYYSGILDSGASSSTLVTEIP